jgi:very-short-patch-repair endonuclease
MLKYQPHLKEIARQLRKNMTESERVLWSRLRGKQLFGVQFYRQRPVGKYIVDFFAPKARLIIEVDGSQHMETEHAEQDDRRDRYLASLGLRVLRFNSREVLKETDEVMRAIYREIPLDPPLGKGEDRKNPPQSPFEKGGRLEEEKGEQWAIGNRR